MYSCFYFIFGMRLGFLKFLGIGILGFLLSGKDTIFM